jgi:hypothetical protein
MNKFLIVLSIAALSSLAGCKGNNSVRSGGGDTVKNQYGSVNDTTGVSKKTVDTNKMSATTGDASDLDNSASGGTKVEKDTSHKTPKK